MFDENQNFPMVGDSAASQSEHTLADQLRHAKGGLAETEQSFRDLFDEAQIAHVYEDADSRILRADRAAMTSGIVLEMPRNDDGRQLSIRLWSGPLVGEKYIRMVIDITDRVSMEQEKTRLEAQNTHLLNEIRREQNAGDLTRESCRVRKVTTRVAASEALADESGGGRSQKGVFCKEGEYWTVAIGEQAVRLKDSKGLEYIADLLRHPGVEFHATDLAGGIAVRSAEEDGRPQFGHHADFERVGVHIGNLGDAGELIDEQAKRAYRRRLSELREELEEAKALGKVERAKQSEEEIEAITMELSRAVGLGGRNRRAASVSERARQAVTKAIKGVIERIARSDHALAEIFSRTIKTGAFCSYRPVPDWPITWQFASTTIQQPEPAISGDKGAPVGPAHAHTSPGCRVLPFSTARQRRFVGGVKRMA
jgi:hypothetical protein